MRNLWVYNGRDCILFRKVNNPIKGINEKFVAYDPEKNSI
jgi:hypothetical protein